MAWQFAGLTKFSPQEDSFCCELARDLPPHTEVLVYLPLYIGIRSIAIGLEKGRRCSRPLPQQTSQDHPPFYGTSITQGGCASRPGMAYPAILSRELDREVVQFGVFGQWAWECQVWLPAFAACPGWGRWWWTSSPTPAPRGCWKPTCQPFWMRCAAVRRSCRFWCFRQAGRQNAAGTAPKRNSCAGRAFSAAGGGTPEIPGDSFIWFASARDMLETVAKETTVDGVHLTDLGFWLLAQKLRPLLCRMLEQGQTNE